MSDDEEMSDRPSVRDAHKALGLWSIRRALIFAFSGAVVLLVAAWFFVSWLLGSPPREQAKPLDTAAQLELLKLVFALVAGIGALVALVTAYRRQRIDEAGGERAERIQAHAERVQAHAEQVALEAQRHAERVARDTAHDATERRVTDLYGQAVEQLGHDKAAVRLGGLYSLERLAQDHPQHRQTVIDVVCAYLRMPFQPPELALIGDQQSSADQSPPHTDHNDSGTRQELQVRLAAQRLITRHLTLRADIYGQPPGIPDTYWEGMNIDLTGAHLIDFDFSQCQPQRADLRRAQFSGHARFDGARFSGTARFNGARFSGTALFNRADFSGNAGFAGTDFSGDAGFDRARFSADTRFDEARFSGDASFSRAEFSGDAGFARAHFSGDAWFNGADFSEHARFDGARFSRDARFDGARFSGDAWFDEAEFTAVPDFTRATASYSNDRHIWPAGWQTEPSLLTHRMVPLVRRH